MSYRTLTELESDVRTRYDIEGFTARHPSTQIIRWLNDAWRELRERITVDGSELFLSVTGETCTAIGPSTVGTGTFPGTILSGAGSFLISSSIIRSVMMKNGSSWVKLREASFDDALNWSDLSANSLPQAWCLAGVDFGHSSGSESAQVMRIMVMPPNNAARDFRVCGLSIMGGDLVAGDRIMTDFGMNEYLIKSCGVRLATRDDDVNLWQARKAELQECYSDILRRSKSRTPGRASRVDTRGRYR